MMFTRRQPPKESSIARMLGSLPRLLVAPFLLIWVVTDPQQYQF